MSGTRATPRRQRSSSSGTPALAAVCSRVGSLEPESVAHYWGVLDAAGRTEATIVRAAAGERRVRRFVSAAARAGATARLEELAARGTPSGRYAAAVLRPPARDSRSGRYTERRSARGGGRDMTRSSSLWVNRIVLGLLRADPRLLHGVTFLSWIQVRRYYRRLVHARLQRSVRSRLTPPISICTAAYNEAEVIVDAMRSMLEPALSRSTRSCSPTTGRPTRRSSA